MRTFVSTLAGALLGCLLGAVAITVIDVVASRAVEAESKPAQFNVRGDSFNPNPEVTA